MYILRNVRFRNNLVLLFNQYQRDITYLSETKYTDINENKTKIKVTPY